MHWLRYSIYELQIKRTNAGRIMMIFERVCRRHAGVQMTRCCCLRRPMSRWSTWSCSTRATCLLRQMSAPFVGLSQQCRSSTSRRSTDSWKTRRVYGKCHEKHACVLIDLVREDWHGRPRWQGIVGNFRSGEEEWHVVLIVWEMLLRVLSTYVNTDE